MNRQTVSVILICHPKFLWGHKNKITLNYHKSAAMGFFSKGPKNEFKTAMANGSSVFKPLKVNMVSGKQFYDFCFLTCKT